MQDRDAVFLQPLSRASAAAPPEQLSGVWVQLGLHVPEASGGGLTLPRLPLQPGVQTSPPSDPNGSTQFLH